MSDKEKSLPPSLDLAFEWVKDVLTDQIKEVNALDTKVVALFSVGTAIISLGLGIPLGISVLPFNILLSSVFGWLTFISLPVNGGVLFSETPGGLQQLDPPSQSLLIGP